MKEVILYPAKVTAYRNGKESKVHIHAIYDGIGYCNLKIEQSLAQIFPPIFLLVGEPCLDQGFGPTNVYASFPYPTDIDYIYFQMSDGTQKIPIVDILQSEALAGTALSKPEPNQVIGHAYFSNNYQEAFADAVSKLQAKFPGQVSATIKESGFVAVGGPIGIAFTYVVMENET